MFVRCWSTSARRAGESVVSEQLRTFVSEHEPRVRSLARFLVKADDVDDVVQQVFVAVVKGGNDGLVFDLDPPAQRAWLDTAVHHEARKSYRGDARRRRLFERIRRSPRAGDVDRIDGVSVIDPEDPALGQAWDRLGTRDRVLLWQRCVDGWSYDDIAANLDIGIDAARRRCSRARDRLRRLYVAEGGER